MLVLKFGGTSLGSRDAFVQVIKIVRKSIQEQMSVSKPGVIIVASAMSGVTNLLIDAVKQAAIGNETFYQEAQTILWDKHQQIVAAFVQDSQEQVMLNRVFQERLTQFQRLCGSVAILGELTNRGIDVVSGLGERLSTPLLTSVLRTHGIRAEFVDASEIIYTDNAGGGANPIMDLTEKRCKDKLFPLLKNGITPVITGFVGTSISGTPTTLGRGGSDYSASIIGGLLDVDEVQIWTDVNGVMTADPKIVSNARSIDELNYEEVSELAYYGAKVLHPKTVTPLISKQIPLRVCNTFDLNHPGTYIIHSPSSKFQEQRVKAVTSIRNVSLITVAGRGFIGIPGTAARTFASTARVTANVLMISQSSSEQVICFIVNEADTEAVIKALQEEFEQELRRNIIDQVIKRIDISVVAIVGSKMRGTPGIAASMFNALAQQSINVIAIAQGSNEANISVVIAEKDTDEAVRAIHAVFRLNEYP